MTFLNIFIYFLQIFPKEKKIRQYMLGIASVSCQMDFVHFPMDKQRCPFVVSSTNYNKDKVTLIAVMGVSF